MTARRHRPNFHVDHKEALKIADRNVQLIQLVDLNQLALRGAFDEKEVIEILKERYDECVADNRSMIICDLLALTGVNKSEHLHTCSSTIS